MPAERRWADDSMRAGIAPPAVSDVNLFPSRSPRRDLTARRVSRIAQAAGVNVSVNGRYSAALATATAPPRCTLYKVDWMRGRHAGDGVPVVRHTSRPNSECCFALRQGARSDKGSTSRRHGRTVTARWCTIRSSGARTRHRAGAGTVRNDAGPSPFAVTPGVPQPAAGDPATARSWECRPSRFVVHSYRTLLSGRRGYLHWASRREVVACRASASASMPVPWFPASSFPVA